MSFFFNPCEPCCEVLSDNCCPNDIGNELCATIQIGDYVQVQSKLYRTSGNFWRGTPNTNVPSPCRVPSYAIGPSACLPFPLELMYFELSCSSGNPYVFSMIGCGWAGIEVPQSGKVKCKPSFKGVFAKEIDLPDSPSGCVAGSTTVIATVVAGTGCLNEDNCITRPKPPDSFDGAIQFPAVLGGGSPPPAIVHYTTLSPGSIVINGFDYGSGWLSPEIFVGGAIDFTACSGLAKIRFGMIDCASGLYKPQYLGYKSFIASVDGDGNLTEIADIGNCIYGGTSCTYCDFCDCAPPAKLRCTAGPFPVEMWPLGEGDITDCFCLTDALPKTLDALVTIRSKDFGGQITIPVQLSYFLKSSLDNLEFTTSNAHWQLKSAVNSSTGLGYCGCSPPITLSVKGLYFEFNSSSEATLMVKIGYPGNNSFTVAWTVPHSCVPITVDTGFADGITFANCNPCSPGLPDTLEVRVVIS